MQVVRGTRRPAASFSIRISLHVNKAADKLRILRDHETGRGK
jgi:hypothetical protein